MFGSVPHLGTFIDHTDSLILRTPNDFVSQSLLLYNLLSVLTYDFLDTLDTLLIRELKHPTHLGNFQNLPSTLKTRYTNYNIL